MAEVQVAEKSRKPQAEALGPVRRRKRVNIRIDMTPMVDVAFLLLIFFMVTTVFRRPLAMEVNLPEAHARVEVPESNVLTVYIDGQEQMFYKMGPGEIVPTDWTALDATIRGNAEVNPDLIVLVKISRDAPYEYMVDMMDALEDAHMERFSVIALPEADAQMLQEQAPEEQE